VANFFLDSSAVVKRYVTDLGSGWVRGLTDPAVAHDIYLARITGVEVVSSFVRQAPPLPVVLLTRALTDFRADFQNQYQLVAVNEAVVARAMDVAEKHRLWGYDAVQLAAALELLAVARLTGLPSLTFVSADTQLNGAAAAEGLSVDNPTSHP
jgi:predicted nucleic acid-binding protein